MAQVGPTLWKNMATYSLTLRLPHRLGRQRTSEGLATSLTYPDYFWTEPAYPLPDDFDLHSGPLVLDDSHHPSSYSPADRGLRAELEEEYQEYGRFINNDILNGTARRIFKSCATDK